MIEKKILNVVEKHRYGLTIENISELIGVSRPTASKYLFGLEKEGRLSIRIIGKYRLHYPLGIKINETRPDDKTVSKGTVNGIAKKGLMIFAVLFLLGIPLFLAIPDVDYSFHCEGCTTGFIPPQTFVNISVHSSSGSLTHGFLSSQDWIKGSLAGATGVCSIV